MENAFGYLAARWRICHTKMVVKPNFVTDIVKVTGVLHNMLYAGSTDNTFRASGLQVLEIRGLWKIGS